MFFCDSYPRLFPLVHNRCVRMTHCDPQIEVLRVRAISRLFYRFFQLSTSHDIYIHIPYLGPSSNSKNLGFRLFRMFKIFSSLSSWLVIPHVPCAFASLGLAGLVLFFGSVLGDSALIQTTLGMLETTPEIKDDFGDWFMALGLPDAL